MQKGSALPILLLLVLITLASTGSIYFFYNLNKPKLEVQPPSVVEEITQVEPKLENPIQVFASENNEQKFSSSQLKFEFGYPDNLSVVEDTEKAFNEREHGDFRKNFAGYIGYEPGKFFGATLVLDDKKSYETNPLTVWVFENPENLSADKWYANYWYYPFVWGDFTARSNDVAPSQEMTVAGQVAKYGIVTYRPGEPKFIYLSAGGKMYLFRVFDGIGEEILQSFKFI